MSSVETGATGLEPATSGVTGATGTRSVEAGVPDLWERTIVL